MAIASCYVRVSVETRDFEHIEKLKTELAKAGFQIMA
jgi:hypothetical protein